MDHFIFWGVGRGGDWAITKKKNFCTDKKSREKRTLRKKSPWRGSIPIKKNPPWNYKSRLRKECSWASLPKTWIDQSYGTVPTVGFCASENGIHVFTLWKAKLVRFKRSSAGNVVSVARIKKSLWNSSHCSTAPVIYISISLHLPLLMCRMMTLAHVFQSCSQDSLTVQAIMSGVLGKLKEMMPTLCFVYYRQDNAGCYRSGNTILGALKAGEAHRITEIGCPSQEGHPSIRGKK